MEDSLEDSLKLRYLEDLILQMSERAQDGDDNATDDVIYAVHRAAEYITNERQAN